MLTSRFDAARGVDGEVSIKTGKHRAHSTAPLSCSQGPPAREAALPLAVNSFSQRHLEICPPTSPTISPSPATRAPALHAPHNSLRFFPSRGEASVARRKIHPCHDGEDRRRAVSKLDACGILRTLSLN